MVAADLFLVDRYRKAFVLPEEWGGQHIFLRFDGAFQFSEVYLNGAHLQDHSTGYVSWTCRLDNATSLSPGKNILAIRVDPSFGSGHWCAPAALKTFRACLGLLFPWQRSAPLQRPQRQRSTEPHDLSSLTLPLSSC